MEEGGAGPRLLPNARLLGFFWLVTVFLLGLGLRFAMSGPEANLDQTSRLTERITLVARHTRDLSPATRQQLLETAEQLETEPERLRVIRDEEVPTQSLEGLPEGFRLLADYQAAPEPAKATQLQEMAVAAQNRLQLSMGLVGALLATALVWSLLGRTKRVEEVVPMTDMPAGRILAVFMAWDVLNLFVVNTALDVLNLKSLGPLALVLAAQAGAYGLMLLLLRRYKEPGAGWNLRLPIPLAWVGRGYFAGLALVLLSNLLITPLRGEAPTSDNPLLGMFMQAGPLQIAVLVMLAVVVGPFFEELMFRGWLMAGLRQHWGEGAAIVVSSALFAVIHADLWATPALFLLGCVFAKVYLRSGTLWASILLHTLWNAGTFVLLLASMP